MLQKFILKLIDSTLNTFKTVLMIKGYGLASALVNGLSTLSYMLILVDMKEAITVAMATTIGNFFTVFVAEKYESDKVWIFDVIPKDSEEGKRFADMVREENIEITTYVGFNNLTEKVICSKIHSKTKEESKFVKSLLTNNFKYSVNEAIQFVNA